MNVADGYAQIIQNGMLDKWDYCLRKLFVLKSTPLKNAIGYPQFIFHETFIDPS